MVLRRFLVAITAASGLGFGTMNASADVITQWNFNTIGVQSAPYNDPAATTGTGVATTLGMTNNYNGGNTTSDDVVLTAGTANPSFSEDTWRIRGTSNNGWAASAPQYSQGIELYTSTVGYSNIVFSFDWYSTAQGIRDLQFQYNLNVNNAAGWTNFGGTSLTGTYVSTAKDYYNAPGSPTISVNLSSITGANDDPNFGVRLVSAYDSTGNLGSEYASSTLSTSGATVQYNGTSGNWRFDNLTFSGTKDVAVPEPSSLALLTVAGGVILIYTRKRRAKV